MPFLAREVEDDLFHQRRGLGVAVLVIVVEAGAGLLAAPVHLAEDVADGRGCGLLLRPADVEAGEIAHRERPHRQAEIVEHAVDVPGHGAFQDQLLRLALALRQHAVADEAVADADEHADLADLLGDLHGCGDHRLCGLVAAHDFQQPHHIGRREEVHAEHMVRPRGDGGDLVDVEIGGVGGQDRARLGDLVELAEDVLLDRHVLEHGLDDEVAIGERFEIERARSSSPMRVSTSAAVSRPFLAVFS